ncbi:hypothetical protein [Streptomyces flavidovirens]
MTARFFWLHRPEDMLFMEVRTENLENREGRLVRENPAETAFIVFNLPPQHVNEVVTPVGSEVPGPVPAFCAGPTVIPFLMFAAMDSIGLTVDELLDWDQLFLLRAPLHMGPDDPNEPTIFSGHQVAAIEFPTRLLITPDAPITWVSRKRPFAADGRAELWHMDIRGENGDDALLRAFAVPPGRPARTDTPLTDKNREDLVTLTSRIDLFRPNPDVLEELGFPDPDSWPFPDFERRPLQADRFTLTALGATARLQGSWDFPDIPPPMLDFLGWPKPGLASYENTAGLGRDQTVRVAERGFLSTGHRAMLVSSIERQFVTGPDGVTSIACLREEQHIVVQEPEVHYGASAGYVNNGHEMPFRSLRITDVVTPVIDPRESGTEFWVTVGGSDLEFTVVATDSEDRKVSFTMPLVFTPFELGGGVALQRYNEPGSEHRRTRQLAHQTMALAQPGANEPGTTVLPVSSIAFELVRVDGHPQGALPRLVTALVRVPAIEQLTGGSGEVVVAHAPSYLGGGIEAHATGAFLTLQQPPVRLAPAAEKIGGIAKPNVDIGLLSSRAGAVPAAFGGSGVIPADVLRDIFGDAKLLGSISLARVLDDIPAFGPDDFKGLSEEKIAAILADPHAELPVPILRAADLSGTPGRELRYVWRPKLKNDIPTLDLSGAVLTLDARTVASPDAASRSSVTGELRNFAFDFAGMVNVHIDRLTFVSRPGCKPDVSAGGLELRFRGALQFVNALREILPKDGFGKGAYVDVTPAGINTGYSLAVPSLQVGLFSLSNVVLSAALTIPFDDRPTSFRFSVSDRHHPFNLNVSLFGGGGFFSMVVRGDQLELVEGSLEFGGAASLDLGVASGGVYLMGGVYFALSTSGIRLTGYLRCGGHLSVLGIVTVSVEFHLALEYAERGRESEVKGRGTVSVSVRVAFFSKTVSLTLERRFAGSALDPSFAECLEPADWDEYCLAFAE